MFSVAVLLHDGLLLKLAYTAARCKATRPQGCKQLLPDVIWTERISQVKTRLRVKPTCGWRGA